MSSLVLGSELVHKTIWYPTILGILVVVAAVALFVGSIYVLLATNLGARLGFLVTFTAVMAFMVLLTLLWISTASPLNTLRGRVPSWKVQEVATNISKAKTTAVRDLDRDGRKVGATAEADIKAAVDDALVTQEEIKAEGKLPKSENKYAVFSQVTEFKVLKTREVGGSAPNPLDFELTHKPLYAVIEFCEMVPDTTVFGAVPPKSRPCATGDDAQRGFLVIERDLGSVRVPPIVAFIACVLLFGLGLLLLHWRERDEQEAIKASGSLTPARVEG
jgi:hypothetical protein